MPYEIKNLEEKKLIVPEKELIFEFARSGGKGGQNVNKVETKVRVRWRIGNSQVLTDAQKETIRHKLANRIHENDELVLKSQEERSQSQNKQVVIDRLNNLVRVALEPTKERISTSISGSAKLRKKEEKIATAEKKEGRGKIRDDLE